MSPKKQQQIPGTEPKRIQRIDDRAEAYRNIVLDRIAMQKKEAEAKAELLTEIDKQIEAGALQVPESAEGEVVPVYRFDTDEGEMVVKWGRKEQVKVGKARDDDDEAEAA